MSGSGEAWSAEGCLECSPEESVVEPAAVLPAAAAVDVEPLAAPKRAIFSEADKSQFLGSEVRVRARGTYARMCAAKRLRLLACNTHPSLPHVLGLRVIRPPVLHVRGEGG